MIKDASDNMIPELGRHIVKTVQYNKDFFYFDESEKTLNSNTVTFLSNKLILFRKRFRDLIL